ATPGGATATPTNTATNTATPTSTPTPTRTPTPTLSPTVTATVTPGGNTSLILNGTTAYGEAPSNPELNPVDWTVELWFRDENASYAHPRQRIFTKGDISSSEVPYFASIDSSVLYVGLRAAGTGYTVTFN